MRGRRGRASKARTLHNKIQVNRCGGSTYKDQNPLLELISGLPQIGLQAQNRGSEATCQLLPSLLMPGRLQSGHSSASFAGMPPASVVDHPSSVPALCKCHVSAMHNVHTPLGSVPASSPSSCELRRLLAGGDLDWERER